MCFANLGYFLQHRAEDVVHHIVVVVVSAKKAPHRRIHLCADVIIERGGPLRAALLDPAKDLRIGGPDVFSVGWSSRRNHAEIWGIPVHLSGSDV